MGEQLPRQPQAYEITTDSDPFRVIMMSHDINAQAAGISDFPLGRYSQYEGGHQLDAGIYIRLFGESYQATASIYLPYEYQPAELWHKLEGSLPHSPGVIEVLGDSMLVQPLERQEIGYFIKPHYRRNSALVQQLSISTQLQLVPGAQPSFPTQFPIDGAYPVDEIVTGLALTTARVFNQFYLVNDDNRHSRPEFYVSLPGSSINQRNHPAVKRLVEIALQRPTNVRRLPSFEDFAGMPQVVSELREVADQLQIPRDEYEAAGLDKERSLLLIGPTGVGKTKLIKALAHESGANLETVKATDIMTRYVGEPAQYLLEKFDAARSSKGPVILFFDEFDSMFSANAGGNSGVIQTLVGTLNSLLTDENYQDVFVAAAANDVSKIAPSVLRAGRFDRHVTVPEPDWCARAAIFAHYIDKHPADFSSLDDLTASAEADSAIAESVYPDYVRLDQLGEASSDLSPADIKHIVLSLVSKRFTLSRATGNHTLPPITQSQLLTAVNRHKQTRFGL